MTRNVSGAKAHVQEYEALIHGLRAEVAGLRVQLTKRANHNSKKKARDQRRLSDAASEEAEEDDDDEESSDDDDDDEDEELAGENDFIAGPTTPGIVELIIALRVLMVMIQQCCAAFMIFDYFSS